MLVGVSVPACGAFNTSIRGTGATPAIAAQPAAQKKARDKPGVEAGKASEGGSGS